MRQDASGFAAGLHRVTKETKMKRFLIGLVMLFVVGCDKEKPAAKAPSVVSSDGLILVTCSVGVAEVKVLPDGSIVPGCR